MDREFEGSGEVGAEVATAEATSGPSVEAAEPGPGEGAEDAPRSTRRLNLVGGIVPRAPEPAPAMRGSGAEILSRLDELSRLMMRHDAERAASIEARLEATEAAQHALAQRLEATDAAAGEAAARIGSAEAGHDDLAARLGAAAAAQEALAGRVGAGEAAQGALARRVEGAEASHEGLAARMGSAEAAQDALAKRQETALETIRGSIDARLAAAAQAQAKAVAEAEARLAATLSMQGQIIEALLAEKSRTDTALSLLQGGLAAAQGESEALALRVEERMAAAVTAAEVAAGEAARALDAPLADCGGRLDAVLFHLETAAIDAMPGGARPVRDALRGLAEQIAQVRAEIAALPARADASGPGGDAFPDDEDEVFRRALSGRMDAADAAA